MDEESGVRSQESGGEGNDYNAEAQRRRGDAGGPPALRQGEHRYFLGEAEGRAVFFCHERGREVVLDGELVRALGAKAGGSVVYADACWLEEDELRERDIAFRKVPRDLK